MKEIRFTLGDSDIWHSIYADIDIDSPIQVETVIADIIGCELSKIRNKKAPQKYVKFYDEQGKLIGESPDICELGSFKLKEKSDETKIQ